MIRQRDTNMWYLNQCGHGRYQELTSLSSGMCQHIVHISATYLISMKSAIKPTEKNTQISKSLLKSFLGCKRYLLYLHKNWCVCIMSKTKKTRINYRPFSASIILKNRRGSPDGIRQMKARAIRYTLEARHVLPRVWRGGHGDRDLEIVDIAHYATNRRPSYMCTTLRRNEGFADSSIRIGASSRVNRVPRPNDAEFIARTRMRAAEAVHARVEKETTFVSPKRLSDR